MQLYDLVQTVIKVSNLDPTLCLIIDVERRYQVLSIHVVHILQLRSLKV